MNNQKLDSGGDSERGGKTVLEILDLRTGGASKVSLAQDDSNLSASPIVTPGTAEAAELSKARGNYKVLGEIARGGMGTILRGHDSDLGRDVAIKVLDEELAKSPPVLQRFVEEAQIGGQLQHPGVVPVYELGLMADERPFFTMRLVKGKTLSALLQKRKQLDEDLRRFLSIFEDVCQTVAYAHSKGVIHRDLKPANVMIGAFGEVQVVDWGLAKVLGRGGVADEKRLHHSRLTVIETVRSGPGSGGSDSIVGSVMGTPAYMPPEQARGEVDALDERADVFALGAILCELLTGVPPYLESEDAPVVAQAAGARLAGAKGRLDSSGAAPELIRLALDCLAPAPDARPRNAEEVATAVHRFLSETEERARAAQLEAAAAKLRAEQERKTRWLTTVLAAVVLLFMATAGGGYAWLGAQRRARASELVERVDAALDRARLLQDEGSYAAALEPLLDARGWVERQEADPELVDRVDRAVERARSLAATEEERAELEHKRRQLFARLDEIRYRQDILSAGRGKEESDAAFASAFREYGIDLESSDLVATLEQLREAGLGAELALAIDDWARVKRELHGWDSEQAVGLTALAADLDPDPGRIKVREALMERDFELIRELAEPERARGLGPETVLVLASALLDAESPEDCVRLARDAAREHPGDFHLQFFTGRLLSRQSPAEPSLALALVASGLDHLLVARGLRPDNAIVHDLMAGLYLGLGDLANARKSDLHYLALADPDPAVRQISDLIQLLLGHYERSAKRYDEIYSAGNRHVDFLAEREAAHFLSGAISREEFVTRVFGLPDVHSSRYADLVLAWGLCQHSNPAQRDPARALEVLDARPSGTELLWLEKSLRVLAYHELGAHEEVLREVHGLGSLLFLRLDRAYPAACMQSIAHHALGREREARIAFDLASSLFGMASGGDVEPWLQSPDYALLQEARELLGL